MGRLRVTAKRRGETEDLQGSRQIHCRESGSSQEAEGERGRVGGEDRKCRNRWEAGKMISNVN
jgi:hypothetical protein